MFLHYLPEDQTIDKANRAGGEPASAPLIGRSFAAQARQPWRNSKQSD
jgi:hypothetical protein